MKIKLRRIEIGLTQEEFSKRARMARCRIVDLEKGNYENLRLREMKKVAEILNSTVEELFLKEN